MFMPVGPDLLRAALFRCLGEHLHGVAVLNHSCVDAKMRLPPVLIGRSNARRMVGTGPRPWIFYSDFGSLVAASFSWKQLLLLRVYCNSV